MNDIEVSSIDLVEGGNVFKQGHYLTLGYVPRDENGETVDLSGKTLNVALWGRKGVVFEAAATFSGGVIRFTLNKTVEAGHYNVEFTATLSTDSTYRKKFPANSNTARISVSQSADDLGVVGISVVTVAKFEKQQKEMQDAYEQTVDSKVSEIDQRLNDGIGAFTTDTEVIDARMGEVNLRQFNEGLTAQLAETGRQPGVMTNLRNRATSGAAITFIDDDATAQVWDVLRPFIQEMNIPYVLAVPPGAKASFPSMISMEQLKIMQDDYNCEITAHSLTHPTFQELTEEQKIYEFTESKRILTQAGLKVQNFVYPYGSGFEESTQRLCTQYFNCGVSASGGLNVRPVKSMDLGRVAIGSFLSGDNDGTIEYYKARLDEAKVKGGWEIYMTHVNVSTHTADVYEVMRQIILYAREIGVDILNLQDGYERYGNIVEIPGKLTIQNDGKIVKDNFDNVSIAASSGITANSPITAFPKNKVSINHFNLASSSGFPHTNAGTLETYHVNDYSTSYQVWRPFIDVGASNIPTFYYRRAMTATTWGPFKRLMVGEKTTVSATFGVIPAGKVVVSDIAVASVSNTDNITISPGFGLPAELIYSIKRVNSTLLRLAVFNPASIDLTISSTTWNLSISS